MRRSAPGLLLVLVLAACSGPPRFTARHGATPAQPGPVRATGVRPAHPVDPDRFAEIYAELHGTRYRHGGTQPAGFDCSGLVGYVYARYNGMQLPRTVRDLFRIGEPVRADRLHTGDLLFYNTDGRGPSHVGIYLWDDLFLHASPSHGVTLADIGDGYFARRYLGARRLLH